MSNPNLLSITSVVGNTAVANVTDVATAIVENAAASNTTVKINSLFITNTTTTTKKASVDLYRNSVAYYILKDVEVPGSASLDVINKNFYLEEGDSFRVTANANSTIHAVCSYEVVS